MNCVTLSINKSHLLEGRSGKLMNTNNMKVFIAAGSAHTCMYITQ